MSSSSNSIIRNIQKPCAFTKTRRFHKYCPSFLPGLFLIVFMLRQFFVCFWDVTQFMFWSFQWCCFVYYSVETGMLVGCVIHSPDGTVWLDDCVLASDFITVTFFVLTFHVTGMKVLNVVLEAVLWIRLKKILTMLFHI